MNKKLAMTFLVMLTSSMCVYSAKNYEYSNFDFALTSGYIWKIKDSVFKEVYGAGIADMITMDACYYPSDYVGIGLKASSWQKDGYTSVLHRLTTLHEYPLIGYVRARVGTRLQGYASLGGGVIFIREKSYMGVVADTRAIGEGELGLNYHIMPNFYLTAAFRVLFPDRYVDDYKANIGGCGLRAGLGFNF